LKTDFKVNDMGELIWLQGIQMTFIKDWITLSQTTFIHKILNSILFKDGKAISTPINRNHHLRALDVD
jgi:hypothetical protein